MSLAEVYVGLEARIALLGGDPDEHRGQEDDFLERRERLVVDTTRALSPPDTERLRAELDGWGPIAELMDDASVTEVILNGPTNIWVERNGHLQKWKDAFYSIESHRRFLDRLCQEAGVTLSLERPAVDGRWKDFRLHAVRPPLAPVCSLVTLRRHPQNPWTLDSLRASGWCTEQESLFLRKLIHERSNFLVIGPTGSGKTSIVNALLALIPEGQRAGVIEDTDEIALPPGPSFKLLTRTEAPGGLGAVDQSELVRQCLRMRPDRLVLGEMRGGEAKDFLLAISTGHAGSLGTLHAETAAQALVRLEMLIQMGAPRWEIRAIRQLIRFGLQHVIITGRNEKGERRLLGVHRLVSLEETGFLLEREMIDERF